MIGLSDNWFLEPVFDFEYKSYQVLGYAQSLNSHFADMLFYPYIDDLTRHLQRLQKYVQAKAELESRLHREIEELDFENKKIIKKSVDDQNGLISELQEILLFAQNHFDSTLKYASIELANLSKEIEIQQLGLSDLNLERGILLFRRPTFTRIYNYTLRAVQRPGNIQVHKDLKTNYVQDVSTGAFTNFNEIKWNILKSTGNMSGSNAFLIQANRDFPHYELVMPIVKKHLINLSR